MPVPEPLYLNAFGNLHLVRVFEIEQVNVRLWYNTASVKRINGALCCVEFLFPSKFPSAILLVLLKYLSKFVPGEKAVVYIIDLALRGVNVRGYSVFSLLLWQIKRCHYA